MPDPQAATTWASTSRAHPSAPTSAYLDRDPAEGVDARTHSAGCCGLTGLDVEENQARRLLNDLDTYRAERDRQATTRSSSREPG